MFEKPNQREETQSNTSNILLNSNDTLFSYAPMCNSMFVLMLVIMIRNSNLMNKITEEGL